MCFFFFFNLSDKYISICYIIIFLNIWEFLIFKKVNRTKNQNQWKVFSGTGDTELEKLLFYIFFILFYFSLLIKKMGVHVFIFTSCVHIIFSFRNQKAHVKIGICL